MKTSRFFPAFRYATPTLSELLEAFVWSDYDRAVQILEADPKLLVLKGSISDYSERIISDTSPLTYCIWACDLPMWNLILENLPKDPAERTTLLNAMKKQLVEPTTYMNIAAEMVEEKRCSSITNLIAALEKCLELKKRIETAPKEEHESLENQANELWIKQVGTAQRGLPVNLVRFYNDFRVDFSNPDFKLIDALPPVNVNTTFRMYQDPREKYDWYNLKIGEIYAINKGYGIANFSSLSKTCASVQAIEYQIGFLTAYLSCRTEQYRTFCESIDLALKECQSDLCGFTSQL